MKIKSEYKAPFLWPHEHNSVAEAGYEFANARTERYRKIWWRILIMRIRTGKPHNPKGKHT